MPLPLGFKRDVCIKGLHNMTPENVWTRPSDGRRYCRACKAASRAARQFKRRLQPCPSVPTEALQILYAAHEWADNETMMLNDKTGCPISWADWIASQDNQ